MHSFNSPSEVAYSSNALRISPRFKFSSYDLIIQHTGHDILRRVEIYVGFFHMHMSNVAWYFQQYENFIASSSEMLDQTFDRIQNLWNTHVVVWRNKASLDTMCIDDLYNNLKVYEPEVKRMSSSSSSTQNMAFVFSSNNNTCSTNREVNTVEAVNTAYGVSTASTQVNAAYSTNINNLSDAVIFSFFVSQPNSPQLVHEELEQLHPDDMEEMNLIWQMAMLTMRARRFLKKTGRKLIVNGNETIDFDKSNVECYNFHKKRHFARYIDYLGKFDVKADEGFFVGYSLNSKAFRVFNSRTRIVEENLHIRFSESTPNVIGTQSNGFAGTKAIDNVGQARKETKHVKDYILLPLWTADPPFFQDLKSSHDDGSKPLTDDGKKVDEDPSKEMNVMIKRRKIILIALTMLTLTFDFSRDDEDDGAVADINNLDITIQVSPTPTTRIHKDHHLDYVIGDLQSTTQTRKMSKNLEEHRTQKGNSCIKRSKLDRGYAGRASIIQVTRSLNYNGFTK
nr:hypothetical protein [Tanacetum cinerariifolium]